MTTTSSTAGPTFVYSHHDHCEPLPQQGINAGMGLNSNIATSAQSFSNGSCSNFSLTSTSTNPSISNFSREPILKTPVSLLNEVCAKARISPVFDTTEDGPIHERIFECNVTVEKLGGCWRGVGQGRTKKDAKQEAAKALLKFMDDSVERLLIPTKAPGPEKMAEDTVECDPEVVGNPVGELNDMCTKSKRMPPEYEEVSEVGRPHEKVYTIACKLGSQITESGTGRTKKQAKKAAAYKVKQCLSTLLSQSDGISLLPSQDDRNIIEKLQSLTVLTKAKSVEEPFKLADWLSKFKYRSGVKFLSLQENPAIPCKDPVRLIKEISDEQNFKMEYIDMKNRVNENEFFCITSIGTEPLAIFLGVGGSKSEARKNAALQALEFLRVALRY